MKVRCYMLDAITSQKCCIGITPSDDSLVYGEDLEKLFYKKEFFKDRFYLVTILVTRKGLKYIKEVDLANTPLADYLCNDRAWPLLSERVKVIIDSHLTGEEGLEWVKVNIDGPNGMSWIYYVPTFWKELDVLNHQKTTYIEPGFIRRIVLDPEKIKNLAIFREPTATECVTPSLYITHDLKTALQQAELSGIKFPKVAVE